VGDTRYGIIGRVSPPNTDNSNPKIAKKRRILKNSALFCFRKQGLCYKSCFLLIDLLGNAKFLSESRFSRWKEEERKEAKERRRIYIYIYYLSLFLFFGSFFSFFLSNF